MKSLYKYLKAITILSILFVTNTQAQNINYQSLHIQDAIQIGLKNNIKSNIDKLNIEVSKEREKDIANEKLPEIDFKSAYNRITNLKQYDNGGIFNKPTTHETIKELYNFTVDASIPLYMGGKLKADEKISEIKTSISELKSRKTDRQLKLEIITAYLQINHLLEQKRLVENKMKEDSLVIKQVEELRKNGVVTKNEVLRTNLQLSNHKMLLTTLNNDIAITEHQLLTLLSLPEETELHIDAKSLKRDNDEISEIENYATTALQKNEDLLIVKEELKIAAQDKNIAKSGYLPKLYLAGEMGYNYPNMLFFPPEPHIYRLGVIGLNLKYPISNLYKNKQKMNLANQKLVIQDLEINEQKEQLQHQIFKAYQKLKEANEKIAIAKEAIAQAEENYHIVKAKYANQLSLITELIDADNAYLEAESALISNTIDRELKYYQLQYTIGNL